MKFVHLSDLHIGKRVNGFSMLEDQTYILNEILRVVQEEAPDGVLIAGDVYDKSVPSAEAVQLFDDFLCRLAACKLRVFIISGNHDSAERLSFGGRLMDASGIHISPVYDGEVAAITLTDTFGPLNVYMLPFIKPVQVRRFFSDAEIDSYTDAVQIAVQNMSVNTDERNLLITHQFVTGAVRSESEEISVGGSDNVDASVFQAFDYVALGHIHGPQSIDRDTIRYCGTPFKYSFSEAGHHKSVTVVEFAEKGNVVIRTVPLTPVRDMREVKGAFAEITQQENSDDYMRVTLTDEEEIPEVMGRLRMIYPNLMRIDYDNTRTRNQNTVDIDEDVERKSPLQLFAEFYEQQNGREMSEEQRAFVLSCIEQIEEESK